MDKPPGSEVKIAVKNLRAFAEGVRQCCSVACPQRRPQAPHAGSEAVLAPLLYPCAAD